MRKLTTILSIRSAVLGIVVGLSTIAGVVFFDRHRLEIIIEAKEPTIPELCEDCSLLPQPWR